MLRKSLSTFLVLLLINLSLAPMVFGNSVTEKDRKFIEKLKANVRSQGTGENSKIKLKLKDGTKLEGYISEINDSGIIVVDKKSGQSVPVEYPQVKQAKGNNWSQKAVAISIIAALIIIPIIIYVIQKERT